MADLFVLLDVGPLGISADWPADLHFYDKLPKWAEDWEAVAIHAAHGEGRAYVFSLVAGDFAFEGDKTALVGESLLALESEEFRARRDRIAALEAALAEALTYRWSRYGEGRYVSLARAAAQRALEAR